MNSRFVGVFLSIVVLGCFITGAIAYPNLPTTIISHWSATGRPNGTMGSFMGTFLLPLIMLMLVGLWALLPRIDPIAPGFKDFRRVYDFFMFLVVAFLAYTYALTLGANLGWNFVMSRALFPAIAVLFFTLGAILPFIKRNWFIGIRTPWTISNDLVWDKTHRLGSVLFEIAAICTFVGTFIEGVTAFWLLIIPILVAVIACAIYSYLLFSRITRP